MTTQEAGVKPTYTVRLTEDLDPAERARVAERVAGATDIDASKFERLLERGKGKDLIRPSSATVANRLASVLAEAGAPIVLVPSGTESEESVPVAPPRSDEASDAADVDEEEALRPRRTAAEPARSEETTLPPVPAAEEALPEPESAEPPPQPEVRQDDPPEEPRRSLIDQPPPPAPEPRGSGLLASVGAVLLGIGAIFGLGFLVDPLAIGILVLAVLALGLALLGQRRATWLPGVGALALVVWALANAESGVVATLADQPAWYAMFAGALLVIIAGWREARRNRVT